jgi:hypothetical protein
MDRHIKSLIEPMETTTQAVKLCWHDFQISVQGCISQDTSTKHGAYIHAWDTAEPPSVQAGEIVLNDNIQDPTLDHTVFVNAANWPSGKRVRRDSRGKVRFGGIGFQPVVVDLKD